MHQTLFFIPREVGGWPLFGFGLVTALFLLASLIALGVLVRRHGWNAETQGYLPTIGLFLAALVWFVPNVGDDRGVPIRGYGTMVLLAVVVGVGLAIWRGKRRGLDPDLVISAVFWMIIPCIVGARGFYVAQYWNQFQGNTLTQTLANIAQVTEGGLVVYGGAVGALLGVALFVSFHNVPGLALADLLVPSGAIAMGIGRIGCLLNGCCYGGPSDLPWAVTFPIGSPPFVDQWRDGSLNAYGIELGDDFDAPPRVRGVIAGSPSAEAGLRAGQEIVGVNEFDVRTSGGFVAALSRAAQEDAQLKLRVVGPEQPAPWPSRPLPRSLRVHPTQVYSAIDGLLLGALLLVYAPLKRRDGELLAIYIAGYAALRFVQEMIRIDEAAVLGTGLSIAQNISVVLLAGAAFFWAWLRRRPVGVVWPVVQPA